MEYKFRGKRKDNGEWVHGFYLSTPANLLTDSKHLIAEFAGIESGEPIFDWNEVIPETVGMWTGLKDKNGIEIYDGDVLGQDCSMVDDYSGKQSIEVQKLIVRWDDERLQWTVFCPDAVLKSNWGYIPRNAYVLNPAKGAVINTMNNIDPNEKQATEEVKAADQEIAAVESEAQEKAMESAEEGGTEG